MTHQKLITCPETAHLEQIEYEDSPAGFRVATCSRFLAGEPFTCTRLCMTRMNQRAGRVGGPTAGETLVPLSGRVRR